MTTENNNTELDKQKALGSITSSVYQIDNIAPILLFNTFHPFQMPVDDSAHEIFGNDGVIKVDDNLILSFNTEVTAGSGNIIISNGSDTRTIDINDSSQVTYADDSHRTISINPTADLIPNTAYTVEITGNAIKDITGNFFAGIDNQNPLRYTTIASSPLMTRSSWENPTIFVNSVFKIDDDLKLYFDEEVVAGSGNIVISNGSDTRIIDINDTSQITYADDSHCTVRINPAADLIPNTTYSVEIASNVILDTKGNSYDGGTNDAPPINYTPEVSNPLLLLELGLQDDSTLKVDENITLYFDEEVMAGNGDIVISNGTDTRIIDVNDASQVTFSSSKYGNTVIINPADDLIPNTTYNIQMSSSVITDTADNAYAGVSDTTTLNFSTLTSNPLLNWSNPWDSSFIGVDNNIFLYFDETVVAGNGDIIISNGLETRDIDINDTSQVTFYENGTIIIDPATDLTPYTTYNIQIGSGIIMDTEGNPYEGFNDQTAFEFNTVGYTGGAVYADITGIQV